MRTYTPWITALAAAGLALAAAAGAQEWKIVEDADWCDEGDWNTDWCEVREITLPVREGAVEVDGGKNGGIAVHGWDRNDILLQAKVRVWDLDDEEAAEYAAEVEIYTDGTIVADGPSRRGDGPNWSVSYRLRVPRKSGLALEAHNGGITIIDVQGEIEFATKNGGVRLARVGGDVYGETKNGGLKVVLDGESWDGEGMDVATTNGGIDLEIPEEYSARLFMGTKNGGVHSDLPGLVTGRRSKSIRATIGDGGPLLRLVTKNGGLSVKAI